MKTWEEDTEGQLIAFQHLYFDLRSAIREELRKLRPWYEGGAVGDPNVAIEALKAIDRLVKL